MIRIKLAGLIILINNYYREVEDLCKEYITSDKGGDFEVSVTADTIEEERRNSEYRYSYGYIESICIYREISLILPLYNAFLLHASVIEVDESGYLLLGPSGIGKSTQTNMWLQYLGTRARVINGDKPIIRYENNTERKGFYAYGTPWCGKEGLQINTSVYVDGLCFLEQGSSNHIRLLGEEEMANRFWSQVLFPKCSNVMEKFLELCDRFLCNHVAYLLTCKPEIEAATLAYEWMSEHRKENV